MTIETAQSWHRTDQNKQEVATRSLTHKASYKGTPCVKTKNPQTNGICERFHKTILDEFYRVAFRKKIYVSLVDLQADLDAWVLGYNEARPHQGRWCYGKTPIQTFRDAASLAREKVLPVVAGTNSCNGADTPTCQIKSELLQPILPETAAATVEETCDRAESARGGFVPYSD